MMAIVRVLAFVGLPSWLAPVLIAGMIAGGMGGAYIKGRLDSASNCREAAVRAQLQAMERDRAIAISISEEAVKKTAELAAEVNKREAEVDRYEAELQKRTDRCDLTPDDIKSLDRLHGKRAKADRR